MSKSKQPSYADLQQQLQLILESFDQSSSTDIDELIANYEKALAIISQLQERLDTAKIAIHKVQNSLKT